MFEKTVCVGVTGASGLIYALRLIEELLAAKVRVWVLYTKAAVIVAHQELALDWSVRPDELEAWFLAQYAAEAGQLKVFGREAWFAPVASGSHPADAMVVVPCTMGALAAMAQGMSENLLERAADVMLKERRPLIIVAGAVIMPPNPGFYHHPKQIGDLVDFVVARILDHLGVTHRLMARWGEET